MTAAHSPADDPFLTDEFHSDPAGVIARVRKDDPVHLIPGLNAWMVTRYDDVRQLFTNENTTNDRRAYENYTLPEEGSVQRWIAENGLFAADPEQHARMRRLVASALTPRAVKRMESQVKDVVEQFAASIRGRKGTVDLFTEFTEPIPNTVIGRITGVPPNGEDEYRWRGLGRSAVMGVSPFLSPEERKRSEDAMAELCDYVRGLTVERRKNPQSDLVSDLVLANDEDNPMTNDEIVLVVASLVAAGTDTTTIGGSRGLRALLQYPEQLELLRAEPDLMPNAVDELLRYDFGSLGLPRYAVRDFTLRGKEIRKGQLLLLSFLGAHRDPEVFPDPDRLDIKRDTKELTIFGQGPHYCLGANLARQELACMYASAIGFLPPCAKLLEEDIEWQRFGMFSRIESLPVDFGE